MPFIGNNQLPYPNSSDEPNVPADLRKLASAVDDAIGGGRRFVKTTADLKAIPTARLFAGMRAEVTNDPIPSANGEYVYKGAEWVPLTRTPVIIGSQQDSGTTSDLGTLVINYRSPDGTPPDIVVVSNGPYVNGYEDYGKDYQLMRWGDAQPDGFQVRVARGGQWASRVPVFFAWLAVWPHPGVKS
jgi:hypothetical protein